MLLRKKRKSRHLQESNLLEMVPVLKEHLSLEKRDDQTFILLLPRRGWLEKKSVQWLKQPSVIHIHLDALGSTVISHCDGLHTVGDIAEAVHAYFGEAAEPLLPRLVKFIEILEMNEWIGWIDNRKSRHAE